MPKDKAMVFTADGLRLEGRLTIPAGATRAAVICHPHPQYGGDMDNPIVLAVIDHLTEARVATLRFNFRGAGDSEGHYGGGGGEARDALAAVALLRGETGLAHVTLAGYSFGAMVALQAGCTQADVDRLIAIAVPLPMFDITFLWKCAKPKLFLLGDRDQYCPLPALQGVVSKLPGENRLATLIGADHFLANAGSEIGRHIVDFVTTG